MISFCWIDIKIDLQINWNSASYASGWAIQKFQVTLINSKSPQLLLPAPRTASVRPNNKTNREMWSTFFCCFSSVCSKTLFSFVSFCAFCVISVNKIRWKYRYITFGNTQYHRKISMWSISWCPIVSYRNEYSNNVSRWIARIQTNC